MGSGVAERNLEELGSSTCDGLLLGCGTTEEEGEVQGVAEGRGLSEVQV